MNKKILILSGISWTDTIQRHQRIANYLAKSGNEIIFIENIVSSKFSFKKIIEKIRIKLIENKNKKKDKKIQKKDKKIQVYDMKVLNPQRIFQMYNHLKVRKLLKKIGNKYDVILNYLPIETTDYIIGKCNYNSLIYDCVRDFSNWGGYPQNLKTYEEKLLKKSDFILTDSYYLKNKLLKKIENKNKLIQILPTLSIEEYEIYKESFKRETRRIQALTYFGSVNNHIDVELLNELSKNYKVNIIGKIENNIKISDKIKIFKFTSNLEELAQTILNISDAIIIPYKGNMDGVIPAKLIQSLATGLPIYINDFYDSQVLKEHLYIYEKIIDLKELIEKFDEKEFEKKRNKNKQLVKKNIENESFKKIKKIIN